MLLLGVFIHAVVVQSPLSNVSPNVGLLQDGRLNLAKGYHSCSYLLVAWNGSSVPMELKGTHPVSLELTGALPVP